MIDHNRRITLKHSDDEIMHEMELRITPLIIATMVIALSLLVYSAFEAYAAYRYSGQIKTSMAFADCLNGAPIDTGDGFITCKEYKTIKGM